MFAQLSYDYNLLPATPVPASATYAFRPTDEETPGVTFVLEVTGRTVGDFTAQAVTSVDGVTYTSLGSDAVVGPISANGLFYIPLAGVAAAYLGVTLTPSGGFDGQVAVIVRSGGLVGRTLPS